MRSKISGTIFVPLDNTALAHILDNTTTTRVVSPVHRARTLSMLLHGTIFITHTGDHSTAAIPERERT